MHRTSSNNEDRPPPSEELFFEPEQYRLYDDIMDATNYVPKLTSTQHPLLWNLARNIYNENDSLEMVSSQIYSIEIQEKLVSLLL